MLRSCGCRISPNHHPFINVLDFWYVCAKRLARLSSNMTLCFMAEHHHLGLVCLRDYVPEVLLSIQTSRTAFLMMMFFLSSRGFKNFFWMSTNWKIWWLSKCVPIVNNIYTGHFPVSYYPNMVLTQTWKLWPCKKVFCFFSILTDGIKKSSCNLFLPFKF